ncbi:MAG: 50S ribosomal protein L35ae [Candidatus Aenigmatarchaeota archaeon]
MEGVILNFRLSNHNKNWNQVIVEVDGINSREEAKKLLGKKVILEINGKIKIGKVIRLHGNKGRVLVRFREGLNGLALMKKVIIED